MSNLKKIMPVVGWLWILFFVCSYLESATASQCASGRPVSVKDCFERWTCLAPPGMGVDPNTDDKMIVQMCSVDVRGGVADPECVDYFKQVKTLFYGGIEKRRSFCGGPFLRRLIAINQCGGNRECVESSRDNSATTRNFFWGEILRTRSIRHFLHLGMKELTPAAQKQLTTMYPGVSERLAERERIDKCRLQGGCNGVGRGLFERAHEHNQGRISPSSQITSRPDPAREKARENARAQILKEALSFPASMKPANQIAALMMTDRSFDQYGKHQEKLESSVAELNRMVELSNQIGTDLGALSGKPNGVGSAKDLSQMPGMRFGSLGNDPVIPAQRTLASKPNKSRLDQSKQKGSTSVMRDDSGITSAKNGSKTSAISEKGSGAQEKEALKNGARPPLLASVFSLSEGSVEKMKVGTIDSDGISLKERLLGQLLGIDENGNPVLASQSQGDGTASVLDPTAEATQGVHDGGIEVGQQGTMNGARVKSMEGLEADSGIFGEESIQSSQGDVETQDLFVRVTSKLRGCYYSRCDAIKNRPL